MTDFERIKQALPLEWEPVNLDPRIGHWQWTAAADGITYYAGVSERHDTRAFHFGADNEGWGFPGHVGQGENASDAFDSFLTTMVDFQTRNRGLKVSDLLRFALSPVSP
jgi:hypothetical protein